MTVVADKFFLVFANFIMSNAASYHKSSSMGFAVRMLSHRVIQYVRRNTKVALIRKMYFKIK